MSTMILDCGNSIIKGKTPTREVAFPHALKALTETEYEQILTRAGRAAGRNPDWQRRGVCVGPGPGGTAVTKGTPGQGTLSPVTLSLLSPTDANGGHLTR